MCSSQYLKFQSSNEVCVIILASIKSLLSIPNSTYYIPVINVFIFLLEKNKFSLIYI